MPTNLMIMDEETIEDKIYKINGLDVMLDSDLAKLYHVETKRINEAVKNNPDKFPKRYLFRITDSQYFSLKSKISTSKGGSRKGHTAFTEQGIYMLATILKSDVATEVSIRIMDAFVKMRKFIRNNVNYLSDINMIESTLIRHDNKLDEIDCDIKLLKDSFEKLETEVKTLILNKLGIKVIDK